MKYELFQCGEYESYKGCFHEKQTFSPHANNLNTDVALNDSMPHTVPSLINMLWCFINVRNDIDGLFCRNQRCITDSGEQFFL